MNKELHKGYTFDRYAWFIAIATLIAVIAISWSALHYASNFYQSYSYREFNELLSTNQFPEARTYVQKLFDKAPLVGLSQSHSTLPPRELKPFVDGVLETLQTFQGNNFQELENQVKRLSAYRPLLREFEVLKDQWGTIELFINNGKKAALSVEELTNSITQYNLEFNHAADQYELLARDMSELFSVRAVVESVNDETPPFYKGGVLKGLPTLIGLPDDIPTLEELRSNLNKVGGKVNLEGENIAVAFKEKLDTLQQIGGVTSEKFDELDKQIDAAELSLKSAKNDLTRLSNGAQEGLKNILVTVLNTQQTNNP